MVCPRPSVRPSLFSPLLLLALLSGCIAPVDADRDGFVEADDCDDGNPLVHPGAPEKCDMLDSDCDGELGRTELDADGDGLTTCAGDCDDDDPERGPTGPGVPLAGVHTNDDAWVTFSDDLDPEFEGMPAYVVGYGDHVLLPGDLDGDGFADVVVSGEDAAYVFRGPFCAGPLPASAADARVDLNGYWVLADFGLGRLGDLNQDGRDDLRAGPYIFYGPVEGNLDWEDADVIVGDWDGSTEVGDYNGDGVPDLAVGFYQGGVTTEPGAGLVLLHHGPLPAILDFDNADAILEGVNSVGAQSFAGAALANVGDSDGDGADDLAIFAPMEDTGGVDRGAVYLWRSPYPAYGSLADAWATWTEIREGEGVIGAIASFDIAAVGALAGDGSKDIIVTTGAGFGIEGGLGQAWYLPGQPGPGVARVADFGWPILANLTEECRAFGPVDSAGDVDGDGLSDWLVSGPCEPRGVAIGEGAPGATVVQTEMPRRIDFPDSQSSVSGGFDTNADGYDDVLVGRIDRGAWLFLGGPD